MAADHADTDAEAHPAPATGIWARATAPQSEFTIRQVGIGAAVLVIGLVVTFGLPLLFA